MVTVVVKHFGEKSGTLLFMEYFFFPGLFLSRESYFVFLQWILDKAKNWGNLAPILWRKENRRVLFFFLYIFKIFWKFVFCFLVLNTFRTYSFQGENLIRVAYGTIGVCTCLLYYCLLSSLRYFVILTFLLVADHADKLVRNTEKAPISYFFGILRFHVNLAWDRDNLSF